MSPASCVPPAAIMMFGAPAGGSAVPSRSALFRKLTPIDQEALLGRRLSLQHLRAIGDAHFLLDDVVSDARGHVVAVGPDGGARVVGEQRPLEHIAVVLAERIRSGADRVADRIGRVSGRCGASWRRWWRWRRRPSRRSWIGSLSAACCLARSRDRAGGAVVRLLDYRAPEDRHDDEPPLGQLVVADHGIAVGAAAADLTVAGEQRVSTHGPEERASGRVELRALLREDGELRVDDLEDVVRPHGEAVVRRIAWRRGAGVEPRAQAVEALEDRQGGSRAVRGLLDHGAGGERGRWRDLFVGRGRTRHDAEQPDTERRADEAADDR